MSDLLQQLKDAKANKRPYPFTRIDGDMAVAPVYAVHDHDVMILMMEISNRDARIAKIDAVLDEILNYSGGANNALEDEYVMERVRAARAALGEKE
jgi:hypothetical protein